MAEQVGARKYYGKSSSAIVPQDDYNTKRPLSRSNTRTKGPENHRCYIYSEKSHLACSCRNKRNPRNGPSNTGSRENRRVNMAWVNTGGDYSSDEEQVYARTRKHPKLYNTKRRSLKEKRSESQREFNLRCRMKSDPMQVENDHPTREIPEKKLKSKRQASVIDQVTLYDVLEDILSMQSSATIAQMLQYPNQRRNLAKILRHNPQFTRTTEINHMTNVGHSGKCQTTAAKYHVRIQGNPIVAILDSRAAVSIITNRLRRKLGLGIDATSKVVVVTANGQKKRALGQIKEVKLIVQGILIPTPLQVIESPDETLLLGTDWFKIVQVW